MVKVLRESNEIKKTPIECIKGATLLSKKEVENLLTKEERRCTYQGGCCFWWLRSPGNCQYRTTSVLSDGSVSYHGLGVSHDGGCVRPALILNLNSSTLQIGDVFEFGDNKFKIISNKYALCEEAIGRCIFRKDWRAKDSNVYEKSDVKKYVDNWFQDEKDILKGIKTDKMIADEMDLGF